jgi:hypothetical protein
MTANDGSGVHVAKGVEQLQQCGLWHRVVASDWNGWYYPEVRAMRQAERVNPPSARVHHPMPEFFRSMLSEHIVLG